MDRTAKDYTPEELSSMATGVAAQVVETLSELRVSAGHSALIMAVACAEVHRFVYGFGGLEKLRDTIDACEKQHPGMDFDERGYPTDPKHPWNNEK